LIYTLLYDTSLVQVDAAAKRAEIERRRKVFTGALLNMKVLARAVRCQANRGVQLLKNRVGRRSAWPQHLRCLGVSGD